MSIQNNKTELQEKFLHILIKNKDKLLDFFSKYKNEFHEFFDTKYNVITKALCKAASVESELTKVSFSMFVKETFGDSIIDILAQEKLFNTIYSFENTAKEDYEMFLSQLKDDFLKKRVTSCFENFSKSKDKDFKKAISDMIVSLQKVDVDDYSGKYFSSITMADYYEDYLKNILFKKDHKEDKIICGIREIDETMSTGFCAGHLNLFVAPPSNHKTTMLINLALNINKKCDVVFVPLEMDKSQVMDRIAARRTSIDSLKLANPWELQDSEIERLKTEKNHFTNKNKLIIANVEKRPTIKHLFNELENILTYSSPKVVVIDYLTLFASHDKNLKDFALAGEICKELRHFGRSHGICWISALQLGKESIKRVKTQKEGKESFASDDIRGSHDFAADADNIYFQRIHPNEPTSKLIVYFVKNRQGKSFYNNNSSAILDLRPDISLITSPNTAILDLNTKIGQEIAERGNMLSEILDIPSNISSIDLDISNVDQNIKDNANFAFDI